MTDKKIKGYECRFATHVPSDHPDKADVHIVKEIIHYDDGSTAPNLRYIKDYKRPFWVTNLNARNHQQKKETESLDNLREYSSTQSDLRHKVAQALDKSWSRDYLKKLSSSPYLYGSDVSSTSLIKQNYQEKFPDLLSQYSVAVLDIETDVVNGTDDIIMVTIASKNKLITAVHSNFVRGFADPIKSIHEAVNKYIPEYVDKRNLEVEVVICDTVPDLLRAVFKRAHEWKPDFLAAWNIDFDIPKILDLLEKYNVDPKTILCDPDIPMDLRICKYKQGPKKKVTASGKETPINPAAQWHTLICTSSFYFIDAMCTYKHLRLMQQEESSYALDAILNKELGIRKLKFKEADNYSGLKWHKVMQSNFKLEYTVYNMFDCISVLELDEKTKDLSSTLPTFSGITDFEMFKSQPRRISDALHKFCLNKGHVMATVGSFEEDDPNLPKILNLRGWIITLPAHLSVFGAPCIKEDNSIRTAIRCFVYDSDMVSAYPSVTSALNVSKPTTKRELISIKGVQEAVYRMQNINLVLGSVNAIEYSTNMFNFRKPNDLLQDLI